MENKKSFLKLNKVDITPKLSVKIPTVGEILDDEQAYYSVTSSLTASPFQYMVQLDDMGIDYTTITDYDLFCMMFPVYANMGLSFILGDIDMSDVKVCLDEHDNKVLYSAKSGAYIDEFAYNDMADVIRKINSYERCKYKPGNESAKEYLLKKERRKLKRNANKPYEPYLEKLVIALVNTSEFPYDYDNCMNLSIYRFNQSLRQIGHKIIFDNTMVGVYAGTVDTSKMTNKDILSWIAK